MFARAVADLFPMIRGNVNRSGAFAPEIRYRNVSVPMANISHGLPTTSPAVSK